MYILLELERIAPLVGVEVDRMPQKKLSPHDLPPHKVRISKRNMWNRCLISQPKANPKALLKKLMSYGLGLCGLSFV